MKRNLVVFICPPGDVYPEAVRGPAVVPANGILTLASAVKSLGNIHSIFLDGTVCPLTDILEFISLHKHQILAIGMSVLSESYKTGLTILTHARHENPDIIHLLGNDHFSARSSLCMQKRAHLIDYGIAGNEVFGSLRQLLSDISAKRPVRTERIPGLVFRDGEQQIRHIPQRHEPLLREVDYALIDEVFPHSLYYNKNLEQDYGDVLCSFFGKRTYRSVALEIARGCIKFSHGDPCSFCSMAQKGQARNSFETGKEAWDILHKAYQAGYNYFQISADELPLSFRPLLLDMQANMPDWFLSLPEAERPIYRGYARMDGLCVEKNARLLHDVGFRLLLVGYEAGPRKSLQAFNKTLGGKSSRHLDKLYEANKQGFEQAKRFGLRLDVSYVLGHFGMTAGLLRETLAIWQNLLSDYSDAFLQATLNLLIPYPGSKDFQYLTDPDLAERQTQHLGMSIAPRKIRQELADKWQERDIVDTEEAIADYITAFMPELTVDDMKKCITELEASYKERRICSYYKPKPVL